MMRKGERRFSQRRQSTQFNNKKTHNLPPLENRGSALSAQGGGYKASPRGLRHDNNGQPLLRGILEQGIGQRGQANPRGGKRGQGQGSGYDGSALQANRTETWHNNLESWMSAKPPGNQQPPVVTPPDHPTIADPGSSTLMALALTPRPPGCNRRPPRPSDSMRQPRPAGAPPEPSEREKEVDREARRRRRAERRAKGGHKDSPQATPRERKPAKKETRPSEEVPVMGDPRLAGMEMERPEEGRPVPNLHQRRGRMARPDGATDSRPPAFGL